MKPERARQYVKGDHVSLVVRGRRCDGAVKRLVSDKHLGTYYEVEVGGEVVPRYGTELRPEFN